jgi:hypothetical protein
MMRRGFPPPTSNHRAGDADPNAPLRPSGPRLPGARLFHADFWRVGAPPLRCQAPNGARLAALRGRAIVCIGGNLAGRGLWMGDVITPWLTLRRKAEAAGDGGGGWIMAAPALLHLHTTRRLTCAAFLSPHTDLDRPHKSLLICTPPFRSASARLLVRSSRASIRHRTSAIAIALT